MDYPGTVTLSPTTYERVLTEMLASIRRHGFRRIVIVNGHGGNNSARPAAEAWAAHAVLFLASDYARWITGAVLPVDGGK
jgi:creatinine amidohydrolase/Fe(II)-dependent formamide hydrolase-like protein